MMIGDSSWWQFAEARKSVAEDDRARPKVGAVVFRMARCFRPLIAAKGLGTIEWVVLAQSTVPSAHIRRDLLLQIWKAHTAESNSGDGSLP